MSGVRRTAAPGPTYVAAPVRLLRLATSPSLLIVVVLFGALLDFGATSFNSALFWSAAQCACAAYALAWRPQTLARPGWMEVAAGLFYLILLGMVCLTLTGLPPAWNAPDLAPAPGAATLDRFATLVELVKLVGLGAMCVAGYRMASDEAEGERLFSWITLAAGLYGLWAIVAFLQAPDFVLGVEKQMHAHRLTASFLSANTAASLFGALGCALAVRVLRRVGRRMGSARIRAEEPGDWVVELRDGAILGVLWIALLLTVSRTAVTASLAVLGLFVLLEVRRYARRRRLKGRALAIAATAAAGAFALVVAGSLSSQLQGQFGRLGADAISRAAILDEYLPMLSETPLTGYGLGVFDLINAQRVTEANFDPLWSLGAAHNLFIQWWLEAGPVGTALAGAALALVLVRLVVRLNRGRVGRWRAAAALAASGVLLIHNLVDFPLQVQAVAALWAVLLGLGLAERAPSGRAET